MERQLTRLALSLTILLALLPIIRVKADTGPKPTMQFKFRFQGQPIAIVGGQQLECNDPTCADGTPLFVGGPQRFTCNATSCRSLAYGYKQYHKLIIQFADKTRESNVFQKWAFYAAYTVTVMDSGLQVDEDVQIAPLEGAPLYGFGFLPALVATLVVETSVAAIFLLLVRRLSVLVWVPLASLVTLPVVWFVIPRLGLSEVATLAVAEIFAVVVESVFIYYLSRKRLSFGPALLLSILMNVASFVVGLILF